MAIADLVASPLAKGLFARAIIQSGHGAMVREIDVAQRPVTKLAEILRITPDVAGFRSGSDTAAIAAHESGAIDRKRDVSGEREAVSVDLGGCRGRPNKK